MIYRRQKKLCWNLPPTSEKLSVMTAQRCEGMLQSDWGCWRWSWDWHKRQNMSIREPGRQVWYMKINVCSKQINLIFFKKKTFSFNFRQQSVFFRLSLHHYFPSVSIIIACLCFIIPLYHASLSTKYPSLFLCPFPCAHSLNASLCLL